MNLAITVPNHGQSAGYPLLLCSRCARGCTIPYLLRGLAASRLEKRDVSRAWHEWRKVSAPLSYLPEGTEIQLEHTRRLNAMRFPGKIAALALAAFVVGCSFPRPDLQTYQATIERIEDRPGDFYSPL